MENIFYILLALLGLNFLVFIHELGHYIVARRQNMKVEVFSIGFGRPMISWNYRNVKWQICPIFIGGYVKIAGMEKEGNLEPSEIQGGFYSKKPLSRIKVLLAGPLMNILFSLFVFGLIWSFGGREKSFSEFTRLIGWIDPKSEFYSHGVRPGDTITEYNGEAFSGFQDLIYAAIINGRNADVEGYKIDYFQDIKTPYDYTVRPYQSPYLFKGLMTIGVLAPANYLIFDAFSNHRSNALFPYSPLASSGIQDNDQLIWVDGQLLFSKDQLTHIVNDSRALLTVEREGKTSLVKVPRLLITDLRLQKEELEELSDWCYAANLSCKNQEIFFVPYDLSFDLIVQKSLNYLDETSQVVQVSLKSRMHSIEDVLLRGDKILAVDGTPVFSGSEFIKELQERKIQIIVKRNLNLSKISWKNEDEAFEKETHWEQMLPIASSIGTANLLRENGPFYLLNPVTPKPFHDFSFSEEMRYNLEKNFQKQLLAVKKIGDPEERERALIAIDKSQKQLMLGAHFQDRKVIYNPSPFALFTRVFQEISRSFIALISGSFSPKYMGGPVFIVQVMKQSWSVGIKEALFWLGAISLNLGVLNLLPIPVLDGGHICISIFEKIRGKPLKAKTMQRLIIPFIVLLIFVFFYLTYHDLTRIFGRLF